MSVLIALCIRVAVERDGKVSGLDQVRRVPGRAATFQDFEKSTFGMDEDVRGIESSFSIALKVIAVTVWYCSKSVPGWCGVNGN